MATIGTFTRTHDGFTGTLKTLTFTASVTIKAVPSDNDKAPDYRVYADGIEVGAGWKKSSAAGRDYVSCKLDDPMFPAALHANLIAGENGETHTLIWSR